MVTAIVWLEIAFMILHIYLAVEGVCSGKSLSFVSGIVIFLGIMEGFLREDNWGKIHFFLAALWFLIWISDRSGED